MFHQCGKALRRRSAQDVGYGKGSDDLRSTKGGLAVSGENTLHRDDLSIQCAQRSRGPAHDIVSRACKNRQDCTVGRNHSMRFDDLRDYPMVRTASSARPGSVNAASASALLPGAECDTLHA